MLFLSLTQLTQEPTGSENNGTRKVSFGGRAAMTVSQEQWHS